MSEFLTLRDVFLQRGSTFEIPVNYRIFLHDEHSVIWVEEGNIDIFALEPMREHVEFLKKHFGQLAKYSTIFLGDKIQGRLNFLRNVTSGILLFGFTDQFKIAKPLIVALANTPAKIRKLPLSDFLAILQSQPHLNDLVDQQVEEWVDLFAHFFLYRPHPNYVLELERDQEIKFEPNIALIPSKVDGFKEKILWVKIIQGAVEISGMQTLALTEGDYYYPLSFSTWLQTTTNATLNTQTIHSVLSNARCYNGLKIFNSQLIDVIFFNKLSKEKLEQNKIKQQFSLDEINLTDSFKELSTIFAKESQKFPFVDINHIYRCCQAIGNALNIRFIPLHEKHQQKFFSADEYIYLLCHNSHVYYRRVTLVEEWWKENLGHLLCFYQEEKLPIALLKNNHGYEYYLPETDTWGAFSPEKFPLIQAEAFVFYQALPNKQFITNKEIRHFLTKDHHSNWAFLFFYSFLTILCLSLIPFFVRQLYGVVIANLDYVVFAQVGLAFLLLVISVMIFSLSREFVSMCIQTLFDQEYSSALWQRVLSLSIQVFRKISLGDLFNRLQITNIIRIELSRQVVRQLLTGLFSILFLIPMFYYNSTLSWVVCGIWLASLIILCIAMKRAQNLTEEKLILSGSQNEKVLETLLRINTARIYGCENRFFSRWEQGFLQIKRVDWKIAWWKSLIITCNALLSPLSLTCIYGFMIFQKVSELQSVETVAITGGTEIFAIGDFMGFYMAYVVFSASIVDFSNGFIQLTSIKPAWNRSRQLLQEQPDSASYRRKPGLLTGEVRIDHVDFRYDPEFDLILSNISLYAEPGEFIAIVGHSGCGKSTLMRLLIGFEKPENGVICYNGKDLATLDLQDVRSQMGIILQTSAILDGTIRDNVVTGRVHHDDQIMQALKLAGFSEDLELMPMKLDTVLMNGGGTLSGGQRQRLLIARALIGNPKILIFDEASSALDSLTQEFVSQNIERLNTTRIVVAHRLSTIRKADRIYVMHEGKIVDQGSFHELSSRKGIFYDLVQRQQSRDQE